jgi:hypothetical protein
MIITEHCSHRYWRREGYLVICVDCETVLDDDGDQDRKYDELVERRLEEVSK